MEIKTKITLSNYRSESDSIGSKNIPQSAYYGVQSQRAAENFHITGLSLHPEIINSLAYIKKACAITNCEVGLLSKKKTVAIVQACDEILNGKLHEYFIVDPIQGGAGTSINMNANEVIANRAIEILGGNKGDYTLINPNDDVNCGQSTNDVIPTAGKITTLRLLEKVHKQLLRLYQAFLIKAEEFDDVTKMGRTQLQDAVPIRLGQEFNAYAAAVKRDLERIYKGLWTK
jgi:aspartate ammonia-lyase